MEYLRSTRLEPSALPLAVHQHAMPIEYAMPYQLQNSSIKEILPYRCPGVIE